MKILFAMASPEYLRYYDATLRLLASRGHAVVIGVNVMNELKPVRLDGVADQGVSVAGLIPGRGDRWEAFARALRGTMDFVRYLHPELAGASALRERIKDRVLPRLLHGLDRIPSLSPAAVARAMRALAVVERAIPVSARVDAFVAAQEPDLVLVSPLVDAASDQVEVVKAARARGIPTAACIASWDNLTNKGDLRVQTDRVIVWNEPQAREAAEFHRVARERIVVTGAQLFDRWFDRGPSRPRHGFCRQVGLPDGKPYVLFVGSSVFISRADVEVPFVRRWIAALRASSDPAVRGLAVLIRPHPYNGAAWADIDLSDLGDVAVWPRGRHNPVDEANRADFFDSMFHSAAVVGVNTSAMIESAIVGRPVLSIVTPEFAATQEGTLHFRHLLPQNGGFLRVASTLDEHVGQLAGVLRDPAAARDELSRFVASFIRPHGTDRACTPVLVDAIERIPRETAPAPVVDTGSVVALRLLLAPVAWLSNLFPEDGWSRLDRWRRERRLRASRARQIAIKRLVVRPARAASRVTAPARRTARTAVRLARRLRGLPAR